MYELLQTSEISLVVLIVLKFVLKPTKRNLAIRQVEGTLTKLQEVCSGPSKDQTRDYEYDPMNVRNTYCCANGGTCPAAILNSSRQSPWYCRFIKPFVFCIITSLLGTSIYG